MKKLFIAVFALFIGITAYAQNQGGTPQDKAQRLTDRMKTELNLTDDQYKQVYDINLQMATSMDEIEKGNHEARQAVKAEYEKQLATVLNEEQMEKAKEMHKQRKGKMKGRHGERMHQNKNNN